MNILIARPCLVFAIIIVILWMKWPLFWAISDGLVAALTLYRVHVSDALSVMGRALVSKDTVTVILSFYFITFLQRMLKHRNRLKQAEQPLNWLLNNRQVNVSAALAVIGLLPSAGTVTIYAEIIRSSCQDYLSNEDMTCVTSFYRRIPEGFLPTYSSILIALAVSGVGAGEFVLIMLSLVAAPSVTGHTFYPGRVPRSTGQKPEGGRKKVAVTLFRSLWSILLIVVLLVAFDIPVYVATPVTAILNIFVDHLKPREMMPMSRTAFRPVIVFNAILIMMFEDIIIYAEVTRELPVFFGGLSIPLPMVPTPIFFFGTIISGSNAIIPLCMPMIIAAMPEADVPLLVLFIGSICAAIQVSPTHVCLFIVAECFKVNIGALVRRNTPMILVFFAISGTNDLRACPKELYILV